MVKPWRKPPWSNSHTNTGFNYNAERPAVPLCVFLQLQCDTVCWTRHYAHRLGRRSSVADVTQPPKLTPYDFLQNNICNNEYRGNVMKSTADL